MTNELGEARDIKDERDSEEYFAMCKAIYDEMEPECAPWKPSIHVIHREAMRRLREKYKSACCD